MPAIAELVRYLLPEFTQPGSTVDARMFVDDAQFAARADETISPEAEIPFTAPGGGGLGIMVGPFIGPDGFRAGWTEWLASWDEFTMTVEEFNEVSDETALTVVDCFGRMAGSQQTLEQGAAALFTAAEGKITRVEHFLDKDQARREAGID